MKLLFATFAILTFGLAVKADTQVLMRQSAPSELIGKTLPNIDVRNEKGEEKKLLSFFRSKPLVLVPIYSRCKSTCPLSVAYLEQKLMGLKVTGFSVVLFSFDPSDQSNDLLYFRKTYNVPQDWSIVTAAPNSSNLLLEAIGFNYMSNGEEFIHPNTLVFLSASGKIAQVITGVSYSQNDVVAALTSAHGMATQPTLFWWCIILLAAMTIVFVLVYGRR